MGRDIAISQELQNYIMGSIPPEPDTLKQLAAKTLKLGDASAMQISWLQACFMQNIVRMVGAKKTIEIGVFTGYSTLATALALPDGGMVTALDIDESWTAIAQEYWAKAGVANKIDLHIAPALDSLDKLINTGQNGTYDMVFIDADKPSMEKYLDKSWHLLRAGGVVVADNVLWGEGVIDKNDASEDTVAIRAFNKSLASDDRFYTSMIPVGDGLSIATKK